MKSPPLPLHRRPRAWYGARTAPSTALSHQQPQVRRIRIPELKVAELPAEIRQAPFDPRLTDLL